MRVKFEDNIYQFPDEASREQVHEYLRKTKGVTKEEPKNPSEGLERLEDGVYGDEKGDVFHVKGGQLFNSDGYQIADGMDFVDVGQALGSFSSAIFNSMQGGSEALGTLAAGGTTQDAERAINRQMEDVYTPSTTEGQALIHAMGKAMEPFDKAFKWAGNQVLDATGSPGAAATTEVGLGAAPWWAAYKRLQAIKNSPSPYHINAGKFGQAGAGRLSFKNFPDYRLEFSSEISGIPRRHPRTRRHYVAYDTKNTKPKDGYWTQTEVDEVIKASDKSNPIEAFVEAWQKDGRMVRDDVMIRMKPDQLKVFHEFDRKKRPDGSTPQNSAKYQEELEASLRESGEVWEENPIWIVLDHEVDTGVMRVAVKEGNHRLTFAGDEGFEDVPVRLTMHRSRGEWDYEGIQDLGPEIMGEYNKLKQMELDPKYTDKEVSLHALKLHNSHQAVKAYVSTKKYMDTSDFEGMSLRDFKATIEERLIRNFDVPYDDISHIRDALVTELQEGKFSNLSPLKETPRKSLSNLTISELDRLLGEEIDALAISKDIQSK